MKSSLRPTTWESYDRQVNKHILPSLGHLPLVHLQTHHLQRLYNEKQQDGPRLDGKPGGLSPCSVRYIHTIIHAALEQAKKEGLITINAADAAKLPKEEKKEIKYLDVAGAMIFLANAKGTRQDNYPLYYLALAAGLRRGELLGLRWQDLDLENGKLFVRQGLVRVKGGLVFQPPKTKLSKRTVDLPQGAINELRVHLERQQEEKRAAGDAYEDGNLVFCKHWGSLSAPGAAATL